ncbi:N5-glutamine methyltransferase [Gammaproteobacteria bacterium]|nr:N5-glutamine methyltransferase [Gammaproteobacteria bacterium]
MDSPIIASPTKLTSLIPNSMTTLLDVMRLSASLMQENQCYFGHGTDNALDEAVALVLGSLHLPHDLHHEFFKAQLTDKERNILEERLSKRIFERIPLPYLLEKAWFMELPFYVNTDVLIPRSPIAEEIKRQFSPWLKNPDEITNILDMCTGSGCIGIACAYVFPDAQVTLVDISEKALTVARKNVNEHQLTDCIDVIKSDLFDQVPIQLFDIIVSNPPYVPNSEMQVLPAEYRHEPILGLEAADGGLEIVKRILKAAPDYLTEDGILIVEVGNTQITMESIFETLPITWINFINGGHGVFVIDAKTLHKFSYLFK